MRRIFYLFLTAVIAASCLDGETYDNYHLDVNFEYGDGMIPFGADSTYFAKEGVGVPYNCMLFNYSIDADGGFAGGFRLSRLEGLVKPVKEEGESSDPSSEPSSEPSVSADEPEYVPDLTWRRYGAPGKDTYVVYYMSDSTPQYDIVFMYPTYGDCNLKYCKVNNTAKVVEELRSVFERGDKLVLTATGYRDGAKTGDASVALADYTQNDKAGVPKDSIVTSWTQFDLSALGSVDYVKFSMESQSMAEGSTPKKVSKYFCLDNLNADIELKY